MSLLISILISGVLEMTFDKKIWIRGAGDIASGVAIRLYRAGFRPIMSDIETPTTVRRTVAFSPAIYKGSAIIEDVKAVKAYNINEIEKIKKNNYIPVIEDEDGSVMREYNPDILIDAIIAKRNLGTRIDDAKLVIALGPSFEAGIDCHVVIETKRGHNLGRVIWSGQAEKNTGIPGDIGGYSEDRIIRATTDGVFTSKVQIGDMVSEGDIVGYVNNMPIYARINGVVRGLLQDEIYVREGMKSGDIDPRAEISYCYTVSDKASAVGGGVLEAIFAWMNSC